MALSVEKFTGVDNPLISDSDAGDAIALFKSIYENPANPDGPHDLADFNVYAGNPDKLRYSLIARPEAAIYAIREDATHRIIGVLKSDFIDRCPRQLGAQLDIEGRDTPWRTCINFLDLFSVRRDHQNQGVGASLHAKFEEDARSKIAAHSAPGYLVTNLHPMNDLSRHKARFTKWGYHDIGQFPDSDRATKGLQLLIGMAKEL